MNRNKIILGLLLIVLGAFLFYWFQWRPTMIISSCDEQSRAKVDVRSTVYTKYYEACLHGKGLK